MGRRVAAALAVAGLQACAPTGLIDRVTAPFAPDAPFTSEDPAGPFPPGLDPDGPSRDGLVVGHRLMAAGEYQLALDAFTRAAGRQGTTPPVLAALGSANLALGRLGQAEGLLRRAADAAPDDAETLNNLGVVLMETGQDGEASRVFRRAFAAADGDNDAIRDNLRLALAKLENPGYSDPQEQYTLVRLGRGAYRIARAPSEARQ
mgnify:CR=1 FL=1